MRVAFLGSPDFALPSLRRLITDGHEIVGVYTQPDRPVGRGRRLAQPPVKALALEHGLPVFQPPSISRPESVDQLRSLAPDVGIIAAYGQILKQPVLDVPPLGVLNVHASLLPRWRGAAPVPAAILAGDACTGATIMRVVLALDAGPMLDRVEVGIEPDDTTGTLVVRVAEAGAALLAGVLPKWAAGAITPEEQNHALATYAPQIKKSDALIDWAGETPEAIWRKVRAYNPWPMAYSFLDGLPLRILQCVPIRQRFEAEPGTVLAPAGTAEGASDASFAVVALQGAVGIVRVQGAGGKAMAAADYVRGHPEIVGKRLGGRASAE